MGVILWILLFIGCEDEVMMMDLFGMVCDYDDCCDGCDEMVNECVDCNWDEFF